jgi:hypothetical protein
MQEVMQKPELERKFKPLIVPAGVLEAHQKKK